jgi:transglutaminase-like putative cysteine protease
MTTVVTPRRQPTVPPARVGGAEPSEPSDSDGVRRWSSRVANLALALLMLGSASGFGRVFRDGTWEGPVFGTVVVVLAACTLTRRLIRSPLVAAAADLVAVVLAVAWTVVPSSTAYGLPLGRTWTTIGQALRGVGAQFAVAVAPVHPTTGFLLLTTAGTGVTTLLAAWLAFRVQRTGWAAVPPLLVFLSASVLGTGAGRAGSVAIEVAVLAGYLLVDHTVGMLDRDRWLGRRRPSPWHSFGDLGTRFVIGAVALSVIVVGLLPGADGHGVLGWRDNGGGGTRIIVSPMVSLATRLIRTSREDVFTVKSPVASYWQLTTLDDYSGDTWQAGKDSYDSFSTALPAAGIAVPKGTRAVRETVHIEALDSPWLPMAFTPVAVSGVSGVQYNAATGSLLTKRPTADGLTYAVTSLQYLGTLDPAKLRAVAAPSPTSAPAGSLQLPATVPSSVYQLARRIVAGHKSEYAEALALQNFFYQSDFTYSLQPPSDGSGISAITTFLFQTHTGYCQQFAGSYAVLARAVGLPTRLAVGFTTGARQSHGVYQVTDANVHTWPEVWFPHYGWVPFEPTKGAPGGGFAIPGATGYTGNTANQAATTAPRPISPGSAPVSTTPTIPATAPADHSGAGAAPHIIGHGGHIAAQGGSAPSAAPRVARPPSHTAARVGEGLAAALLVILLYAVVNVLARRARWARRRRAIERQDNGALAAADAALLVWNEIAEALARRGTRRRASETYREFAARAAYQLDPHGRAAPVGLDLQRAAAVAESAAWDPRPLDREVLADLTAVSSRMQVVAAARLSRRQRLRSILDFRQAWRPRLVDEVDPEDGAWIAAATAIRAPAAGALRGLAEG